MRPVGGRSMVGITRINRLYNTTVQTKEDREAKRPGVFRPGLFGVAKSAFYCNYVCVPRTPSVLIR
jgi:hypothetical protein